VNQGGAAKIIARPYDALGGEPLANKGLKLARRIRPLIRESGKLFIQRSEEKI
jgi:hypothetical protein